MAVYKVIQDIEAEDKLLGPLSLKGLVYAGIVVLCSFINFKLLTSGGGPIKFIFVLLLLAPMILFGVLASPLGGAQPTEVWLLARIKFILQSRKRIWNQSGINQLVTVTVPKKLEAILTKNFSQDEVKSRLSALANTLDSRGWVVKNVNVNLNPAYDYQNEPSDRLIDGANFAHDVPTIEVRADEDILDAQHNPTAQNFQSLIVQAEEDRHTALQSTLAAARDEDYLSVEPEKPTATDFSDIKMTTGFGAGAHVIGDETTDDAKMTSGASAAKLELAQSGNDLSVASIAKLAAHTSDNEVAIALH